MEFLPIKLTKDSSLLLHAIHSNFYWRILKKTNYTTIWFSKSLYKNPRNQENCRVYANRTPLIREEGRGQCIRHLLLKSTPGYVQRHYFQLPPPLCQSLWICRQCVEGGGGVESCWRPNSARVCILYVTRLRTYKIAFPPLDKNLEGKGASNR